MKARKLVSTLWGRQPTWYGISRIKRELVSHNAMKIRLPNSLLVIGAIGCFAEAVYAPTHSDPGTLLTIVLGILLLPRAMMPRTPLPVIFSGCVIAAIVVSGDHGLIDINRPLWIVVLLIGFACFGFWERIQKLWSPA